jgi:hypothetical protein
MPSVAFFGLLSARRQCPLETGSGDLATTAILMVPPRLLEINGSRRILHRLKSVQDDISYTETLMRCEGLSMFLGLENNF